MNIVQVHISKAEALPKYKLSATGPANNARSALVGRPMARRLYHVYVSGPQMHPGSGTCVETSLWKELASWQVGT